MTIIQHILNKLAGETGATSRAKLNTLIDYHNDYNSFSIYDTAANFTSANPILELRQIGYETDSLASEPKFKIGDDVTPWNDLPYSNQPMQGLIKIVDINQEFFSDLQTAKAYIRTFIDENTYLIHHESYVDGVYYFTVPSGTECNLSDYFLGDETVAITAYIVDLIGLITKYGSKCFKRNAGNNYLSNNCVFSIPSGSSTDSPFTYSSGENSIGSFSLDGTVWFGRYASGKFIFRGDIGLTESNGYNLATNSTATFFVQASKYNSNSGSIHGDLASIISAGRNVFFDGVDKEKISNKVTDFSAPDNETYATTLATKNLVDYYLQSNIKIIGDWDASSGSMPLDDESNTTPFITQWGSTIKQGWAFRVGYGQAGTVGGYDYEEGDVVYALLDNAGSTPADWGDLDHNLQQATESLRGTGKVITAAILTDETTTDDERFITGKKIWLNFWPRVLALAHTFAAKITFTSAPRFNSVSASQYLKVDALKDVTSVASVPAADVTEDTTHRFATDTEKTTWNGKANPPTVTDYSATSTIVGWSLTGLVVKILVIETPEFDEIEGFVDGTSNSSTTTITVPNNRSASCQTITIPIFCEAGGTLQVGRVVLTPGSNVLTFARTITGTAFAASGSKQVRFQVKIFKQP